MFTWNISSGLVGIGDEFNVKFLEWGFIGRKRYKTLAKLIAEKPFQHNNRPKNNFCYKVHLLSFDYVKIFKIKKPPFFHINEKV